MHNPDITDSSTSLCWTIQPEQVGERLDRYLTTHLTGLSRTTIQQLISDGTILVNGSASKPGYPLRNADEVRVLQILPATQSSAAQPNLLPLDILYEDDDFLIVNKPAGMVVHPAPGHQNDTLVNALLGRYPKLRGLEGDMRPGIVHRLDRDTSGLLIVAKNLRMQAALIEQMKHRQIEKRYLALVEGNVAPDKGSIDAPIGRDPRHRQQMAITATQSREARTHFRVLQRFARRTLLLLQLETGRTHQIRVHLKAIGHPVVGDPVYGSGNTNHSLQRQFLHAYQLRFVHPSTGKTVEYESPLPPDLQLALDQETIL
jgi:23S rRNA pseudouridine1911/1915/1917 synthase